MVYDDKERAEILAKMQAVSNAFYGGATQTHCHPFIEFTGLLNEYIKMCRRASEAGVDFTQANTHTGEALPMETYEAEYLGEKLDCIYGPSLSDPKVFRAFIASFNLPFNVKIEEEP